MHRIIKYAKWWLLLVFSLFAFTFLGTLKGVRERGQQLPWWHWDSPLDKIPDEDDWSKVTLPDLQATEMAADWKAENETGKRTVILNDYDVTFFNASEELNFGEECGGKCLVTSDTSHRDEADAVLYHCMEMMSNSATTVPVRSHSSQLFVFFCMENPWTTEHTQWWKTRFNKVDGIFNLTMSYRRDSDIYAPYSTSKLILESLRHEDNSGSFEKILKKKTGHSIWIVSNCWSTKGSMHRMEMVSKLISAGLQVEMYGSCFEPFEESSKELIARYKFYLSFENAFHCRDYLTEKVWNQGLEAGAIPIIWGPRKSDVQKLLPPNSFIMVEDFASPRDLVQYLNFLNENDEEYAKFFKWRFDTKLDVSKSGSPWKEEMIDQVLCEVTFQGEFNVVSFRIG